MGLIFAFAPFIVMHSVENSLISAIFWEKCLERFDSCKHENLGEQKVSKGKLTLSAGSHIMADSF